MTLTDDEVRTLADFLANEFLPYDIPKLREIARKIINESDSLPTLHEQRRVITRTNVRRQEG
jgi:hypothetical protein